VIDSHTEGEATRVVVGGGPTLGPCSIKEKLLILSQEHDSLRSTVLNEPRGSDILVGALLCKPENADNTAGVVFFNNVGYLGMCGHGTIGLMVTLLHMGRIAPGPHIIETPVGEIKANIEKSGKVAIRNVASYRLAQKIHLNIEGYGPVTGEVAWGGNWFFLTENHGLHLSLKNIDCLMDYSWKIRKELRHRGITGHGNQEVDHIELLAPPNELTLIPRTLCCALARSLIGHPVVLEPVQNLPAS